MRSKTSFVKMNLRKLKHKYFKFICKSACHWSTLLCFIRKEYPHFIKVKFSLTLPLPTFHTPHPPVLSITLAFPLWWWRKDGYREVWQLDRWLSSRLMSISTRSDNSDSITMHISMFKHQAANVYARIHKHDMVIGNDKIGKQPVTRR